MPHKDPEAKRAYMRARYWANPDRIREYNRLRHHRLRDKIIPYLKQWRRRNPSKVRANNERQWRDHRDERRAYNRAYYQANRERLKEADRERRRRNHARIRATSAAYRDRNRLKVGAHQLEYMNRRNREDRDFNLRGRLRCRLYSLLLKHRIPKRWSVLDLVGCSLDELKAHIERQFVEGMTWENRSLWEIDHIHPCCAFDLREPDQQKACFHFTNLRPLWRSDNRRKTQMDRRLAKAAQPSGVANAGPFGPAQAP